MKKSIIDVVAAFTLSLAGIISLVPGAQGESADAFRESVIRDPDIPSFGNPQGDITIVEYFDYQCPYCKSPPNWPSSPGRMASFAS